MSIERSVVFATDALEPILDLAVRAEASGFQRVWTTEYVGRDAIARALAIAMTTSTIRIGTGVAYAFARLPLAMAALASDVQRLSTGRFGLGVSPGTRGVRRWYGAEFDPPAPRLVELVEELRRVWAGDDAYQSVPVYAPAFNRIMTRHAARACDGLLLHPLAVGQTHLVERVLPAVEAGVAQREDGARPKLIAWQVTSIDHDEDRARRRARGQLAFYFSTPSYSTVVEGTPWSGSVASVRAAFEDASGEPRWDEIGRLIPDDMLDEFALTGTPNGIRAKLVALEDRLASQGISEVAFQTVGAGLSDDEVAANCRQIIDTLGTRPAFSPDQESHHG